MAYRSPQRQSRSSSNYGSPRARSRPSSNYASPNHRQAPAGANRTGVPPSAFKDAIVETFRERIRSRGGSGGIRSIGRIFRRMDDNGNRMLSADELHTGLNDYGAGLSKQDCKILLLALDRTGDGSVSFNEFLGAIRGRMNRFRERFVDMAFDIVDRDHSGVIDFKDIAATYNASNHPDVRSGRMTVDAVFDNFLEKWERNGVVDGKVTRDEFRNYYNDVSASIDSDEYFELMMRNAWHMSGGKGAAQNSSNLRVMVEFVDGTAQVIAIENDMGIDKTDMRALRTQLRRQGYTNIAKVRSTY